jgi:hypothetical protein
MFGSTGWLFADLLLALALAFLLATTFAAPPPKPAAVTKPPHPTASVSPTPKPSPTPTPTGQPEPALDFKYVTVPLYINPYDISASTIQGTIMNDPQLKGRRAGLVMLFAGGQDPNQSQWGEIDNQVWSILQGMDSETPLFRVAVSRQFWNGVLPLSEVKLNVYLFKLNS